MPVRVAARQLGSGSRSLSPVTLLLHVSAGPGHTRGCLGVQVVARDQRLGQFPLVAAAQVALKPVPFPPGKCYSVPLPEHQ